MRLDNCLQAATARLAGANIATARLDVLVLLEDIVGLSRAQLLAHPEMGLTAAQQERLQRMVTRRASHEPLAYIRHKTEFYGREFYIDHRVLEPRPESETMIDLFKKLCTVDTPTIVDIGTGSGALAITAKLELPHVNTIAIDIDPGCLAIAARNAKKLQADITFLAGNLSQPLRNIDISRAILLCNLPYVPDAFQINQAAMQEPHRAIFGGADGLTLYRQLFHQLARHAAKPAYVLTESLPPQHAQLKTIAEDAGFVLSEDDDFIQVFKIGSGRVTAA